MGQFIIEASNIRKKYDDKTVLKDISLQAQRGEAVGLVGVNGCGKSTLLRILAGLSNPSSGKVSLQAGTRMAFIPDRYEKINMTLGKFMEHMYLMETEREGRDRMEHYLHQFHLETMLKTPMKYLSKGIPYLYGTHRKQCSLLFKPRSRQSVMEILKQCLPEEGWNITDFGSICRILADTCLADKLFGICLEKQWHIVRYEEADET